MKKSLSILVLLFVFTSMSAVSQVKRALIVAIGSYDFGKTRWKPINVDNDVILLQETLKKQEFQPANIKVLANEAATKSAILGALDQLAKDCRPDDIVVIHFSSHGQQLQDDGVDEMDQLDEAIVPIDAIFNSNPVHFSKYAPGYIRDDQFGEKVTAIRNNLGAKGDLLVLLDACHSGTGTRGPGTAVVRGANKPMVSDKFDPKNQVKDDAGVFKEDSRVRLNADASSYVVLSGARAQEKNWETYDDNKKPTGSLCYAFTKALSTLDSNSSYRGLFAAIENIMREKSPKQRPVLEGDGLDRVLFGGRYLTQKVYFSVANVNIPGDTVVINAGMVSGITTGSVVGFYASGTLDPAGKQPLQKGKVISVKHFSAVVKLDTPAPDLYKISPWVFVTELSYGNRKVRVKVNEAVGGSNAKAQSAFRDFSLVELSNEGELYLDTLGSVDRWTYKYSNSGIPFSSETFSLSDTAVMKEVVSRFDRFQYLQNLEFKEDGLSAKVELVFLDAAGNIDAAKLASRQKLSGLELLEGDEVYLKITNTGEKNFFINIVDIQPDGKINPVLPNKHLTDKRNYPAPIRAEDCKVQAGDSLLLKTLTITIAKPYGEEMMKVFLSEYKLDLEDILTDDANDIGSRGPGGVLNNMAAVFKRAKARELGSRGEDDNRINTAQDGTIFSVPFMILPKK